MVDVMGEGGSCVLAKPLTACARPATAFVPCPCLCPGLCRYKIALRSIFNYYSCYGGSMNSDKFLSMGLNTWLQLCNETGVTNNAQRGCSTADLSNVGAWLDIL